MTTDNSALREYLPICKWIASQPNPERATFILAYSVAPGGDTPDGFRRTLIPAIPSVVFGVTMKDKRWMQGHLTKNGITFFQKVGMFHTTAAPRIAHATQTDCANWLCANDKAKPAAEVWAMLNARIEGRVGLITKAAKEDSPIAIRKLLFGDFLFPLSLPEMVWGVNEERRRAIEHKAMVRRTKLLETKAERRSDVDYWG